MAVTIATGYSGLSSNAEFGKRAVVRKSDGTIYVCWAMSTNATRLGMWKSSDGTSWAEQDSGNAPAPTGFKNPSIAIDSSGLIHVVYLENAGMTTGLRYVTFNTSTDTWGTDTNITSRSGNGTTTVTDIAVDANDVPHVLYMDGVSNMGTSYDTCYYINKIGGSWNTKVEIKGVTAQVQVKDFSLTLAKNSSGTVVPQIGLGLSDTIFAYLGNALNATSFTEHTLVSSTSSISLSIANDAARDNTWLIYSASTNFYRRRHVNSNAWSTWDTADTIFTSDGQDAVSAVVVSGDTYGFTHDLSDADIYYVKNTGSKTNLETSATAFKYIIAKWATYNDNQQSTQIDYVFAFDTGVNSTKEIRWNKLTLTTPPIIKNVNETEESTEATNRVIGPVKNVTETQSITEATNRILGLIKNINETETTTEATNKVMALVRNINETEAITEALNRLGALSRVVNETESITEAVNKIIGLIKNVNETESITEATNKVLGLVRVINETVDITEALNKIIGLIKNINETESITEAENHTLALVRVINETEGITEALNKVMALVRVVNETEGITEALNHIRGIIKAVNETVDITEATNRTLTLVRVVNETVELLEAVNQVRGIVKNVTETESITEAVNQVLGLVRTVNETVDITEATNKVLGIVKNIAESESITEAENHTRALVRVITETMGITEAENHVLALVRNINETESITEAVNRIVGIIRVINENQDIAEALNRVMSLVRNVNETEGIIEAVNQVLGLVRVVNETESITELANQITSGAVSSGPSRNFIYRDGKFPLEIIVPYYQASIYRTWSIRLIKQKVFKGKTTALVADSTKAVQPAIISPDSFYMRRPAMSISQSRAKKQEQVHEVNEATPIEEIQELQQSLINAVMEEDTTLRQTSAIAEVELARTQVSKDSDREIDRFERELKKYSRRYAERGYFTNEEDEELTALFLAYIELQYFIGRDYAKKVKPKDAKPLTQKDIHTIQQTARQAKDDYIAGLNKQRAIKSADLAGLAAGAIAVGALIASDSGTRALNKGTLSQATKAVFTTRRDLKVCPICEALDGNVYNVDPETKIIVNGPLIPDDTHPNCRCRYLIS